MNKKRGVCKEFHSLKERVEKILWKIVWYKYKIYKILIWLSSTLWGGSCFDRTFLRQSFIWENEYQFLVEFHLSPYYYLQLGVQRTVSIMSCGASNVTRRCLEACTLVSTLKDWQNRVSCTHTLANRAQLRRLRVHMYMLLHSSIWFRQSPLQGNWSADPHDGRLHVDNPVPPSIYTDPKLLSDTPPPTPPPSAIA